jgi:hypothetical protein
MHYLFTFSATPGLRTWNGLETPSSEADLLGNKEHPLATASRGHTWSRCSGTTSCCCIEARFLSCNPEYCTLMLAVAVLLAELGSGVSARVAAFSAITVPDGAVTLTVRRTVHVVFGAMLAFSWQTMCPVPRSCHRDPTE